MAPLVEEFDEDELATRDWLHEDFFTQVLRDYEKDDSIVVKKVNFKAASAKGDHYASVMFRAALNYEQQGEQRSKSVIIKTMPELEGHKKDMLSTSHIFETEIGMYTEVLPKFERILREVGDNTQLKAPCLHYGLSPKKYIIFEDIVPLGYEVLRTRKPSMAEAKAAYLKLAKIHAVSYKIIAENPSYFDEYRYNVMTNSTFMNDDFMTGGIKNFTEMLGSHTDLKQYKALFETLQVDFLQKCTDSFREYRVAPREGAAYVLCHGDFHYKNIMVRSNVENGSFEDVMLLDYQICYVGPMVNDVINSFYMMLDADLRLNHLDELIYYYFSNFTDTLRRIGFEGRIPTLIEFRHQLTQHRHFELFLLVTFLPVWYAMDEGASVEEVMTSNDLRQKLHYNKLYQEEVLKLLPKYLHAGYLEN